jgi:uncharacterized protein YegL
VGIAVGVDRNNVKHVYGRYVSALVPNVVPDALRSLYLEERKTEDIDHSLILGHDEEVDEILASPEKLFDHIQKDMKQEREANLVRGDKPSTISVDVAFCLDCTGSMSAWIAAAKGQILTITEDIAPKIIEKNPGLDIEIKFSLIGFRDYGDADQIVCFPADFHFSDDKKAFKTHVQSLQARGGGDGPEDLLGALNVAGTQLKWESSIKYLVVVTDAPAHGQDCNDDPNDRHSTGDPTGLTMRKVMEPIGQKNIDLMFCQVKRTNTQKTENQMEKYYNSHKAGRVMERIQLFDADVAETGRFHFIFCLDDSGSMNGVPWQALMSAYAAFIHRRRNDQGLGDLVSTLTFGRQCKVICELQKIAEVKTSMTPRLESESYCEALRGAGLFLEKTPAGMTPMIIFMSDGHDTSGGNPVPLVTAFKSRHPDLVCHCVGLSANCDIASLRSMSDAGGGTTKMTENHTIVSAFAEIAAGCAAMDGMVAKFGEKIAGMVANRICLDHM